MIAFRFAVSDPEKSAEREQLHSAHREHIRNAPFEVISSGPAFRQDGNSTAAALLIARVETLFELQQFNASDPFVRSGVYSDTWLLEWRPSVSGHLEGLELSPHEDKSGDNKPPIGAK